MSKHTEPVVSVRVFYEGTQTARQAFMSLMIQKLKNQKSAVDMGGISRYNETTPRCGGHSGMENYHG